MQVYKGIKRLSKYLIAVEPEFFPQYDNLPKEIKKKFKKQLSCLKDNPKHNSFFLKVF
jgi:mRNA-degrading endonuclease RelE of RelBE toxin-antitoxin system